jgi:HD superfamily phosphohydrolase
MALMHDALTSLATKGTPISPEEHTAALAAALLHDVGHGAYSHTLEDYLIHGFHHEAMSRVLIEQINERLGGVLDRALAIFDGTYERPFFHQLVASQLDMDRLDYLRRDSFYTGVAEGKVGVQRIIKTLRVHPTEGGPDSELTVEAKGIYAVENFLLARRLMYWQVYLHKTVLAGDHLLHAILTRVRLHLRSDTPPADVATCGSPDLRFFLERNVEADAIGTPAVRDRYSRIDDTDVLFSLKQWMRADDPILVDLCRRFVNREFFRVVFLNEAPSDEQVGRWRQVVADWLVATGRSTPSESFDDAQAYLSVDESRHTAYETDRPRIGILDRDGTVRAFADMTDTPIAGLTGFVVKPYVCFPKPVASELRLTHAA